MLQVLSNKYYRMKKGDTLASVAKAYGVTERVLVGLNGLTEEPWAGFLLRLPEESHNLYTVRAGDDKVSLCGSEERFRLLNHTDAFFVGMKVLV